MIKKWSLSNYIFIGVILFVLDRVTKYWAITHLISPQKVGHFLSFNLVYNRGVAWSLFHFNDERMFTMLTVIICLIILFVAFHAYIRWMNHKAIIGEVIVVAGALSNVADRVLHGGVVDFIHFSFSSFSWPIFNIADVLIVVGVCIMFITNYWDE